MTDLPTSNLDFSLQVLKSHTCKIHNFIVNIIVAEISLRLLKRSSKVSNFDKKQVDHTQLFLIVGLKGFEDNMEMQRKQFKQLIGHGK